MKIFSSEPLHFIKNKLKRPEESYYQEESPFEEAWLLGDNPEEDISSLIKQKRFEKRE